MELHNLHFWLHSSYINTPLTKSGAYSRPSFSSRAYINIKTKPIIIISIPQDQQHSWEKYETRLKLSVYVHQICDTSSLEFTGKHTPWPQTAIHLQLLFFGNWSPNRWSKRQPQVCFTKHYICSGYSCTSVASISRNIWPMLKTVTLLCKTINAISYDNREPHHNRPSDSPNTTEFASRQWLLWSPYQKQTACEAI